MQLFESLHPSSQRAVFRLMHSLEVIEALMVPSAEHVTRTQAGPKVPGNVAAATAHRRMLDKLREAEKARRSAHRTVVGLTYAASRIGEAACGRIAGTPPTPPEIVNTGRRGPYERRG